MHNTAYGKPLARHRLREMRGRNVSFVVARPDVPRLDLREASLGIAKPLAGLPAAHGAQRDLHAVGGAQALEQPLLKGLNGVL